MTLVAVVDDDPSIRDALRVLIECQGWHALTCASPASLYERFSQTRVDCVVVDPHLGGPDGDEVATFLNDEGVPFIGLTAYPDSLISSKVAESGAQVMITKPADPSELIGAIDLAMRKS